MKIIQNRKWMSENIPFVSIITTVYNRRNVLPRAIESVKQSTYRNFEYIIVDDGSDDSVDDIISELMNKADFPVAFIKKNNGGVHTARNAAIKVARGVFIYNLDSDDELMLNGIESLIKAWEKIPSSKKKEYWEVVGRACDQNNNFFGTLFPGYINNLPYDKVKKIRKQCTNGHQQAIWRADIMKANPWPEPEGVTFVTESVVWKQISNKYKSWLINDLIMIYHKETQGSYTSFKEGRTNQQLINTMYNAQVFINNWKEWELGVKELLKRIIYYGINRRILIKRGVFPAHLEWARSGINNKKLLLFLQIPIIIATNAYRKKYKC